MANNKVRIGQLRRWRDSPNAATNDQTFLIVARRGLGKILHDDVDVSLSMETVDYLHNNRLHNVGATFIENYSEVIDDNPG